MSISVSSPRLHPCRWEWCRLTFPTNALLINHVLVEHVRKAQPVRRKDLPMLRRVEEGSGESLHFSAAGEYYTLVLAYWTNVDAFDRWFEHCWNGWILLV